MKLKEKKVVGKFEGNFSFPTKVAEIKNISYPRHVRIAYNVFLDFT